MKHECSQCGEVLFGAVNRCWKCGTDIESLADPDIPPVRRAPVDLDALHDIGSNPAIPVIQTLPFPITERMSELGTRRCATASVTVGAVGCLIGLVTGWTTLLGIVGIVLGLIGMQGKQRDLATMGLVLSVIAFFIGFGQIGFDIWTRYASRRWIEELQGLRQ